MLTAKAAENDFVTGWKLGVDAYVTKPFDPEDLITTVNETLMMTPEQLKARRTEELEKANLLSRLESAFDDRF
jgi:DNA-binding response OmpR family regulator